MLDCLLWIIVFVGASVCYELYQSLKRAHDGVDPLVERLEHWDRIERLDGLDYCVRDSDLSKGLRGTGT